MKKDTCSSQAGLTLIEIIIAIVIFSVIAVAVAPIIRSGFQAFLWARDVTDVNAQAELAMDRIAREIRDIDPATITTFTATQLSFNLNGTTPVTYSRNAQNRLLRTLSGSADLLATNVTSLTFSYYQDDWTTATTAGQIWSIRFVLQFVGSKVTESVRTTVFLRGGNKTR